MYSSFLKLALAGVSLLTCVTLPAQNFLADAETAATPRAASSSSLPDAPAATSRDQDTVSIRNLPVHILKDQAPIWSSPARIRTHDLIWLVPLAGAAGAAIATDHHTLNSVVSHDPDFNNASVNASNALLGGMIAAPAAIYGYGHFKSDEHARETGLIAAEAMADAVVVETGLKLVFWRERPPLDHGRGLFFQSAAGANSSFPSAHSVVAWSSAAVMADEYPSPWMKAGVYTLATGVSLTRVMGKEHFPTDVLVGSAAGWLVGHYVFRARHRIAVLH